MDKNRSTLCYRLIPKMDGRGHYAKKQHVHGEDKPPNLYPRKKSSASTWRSGMPCPCSTKVAPHAMYSGQVSEMGLPVTMLPPTEAVLRIWLPAKYLSWLSRAVQADVAWAGCVLARERNLSMRSVRVTEDPTHKPSFTACNRWSR